MLLFKREPTNPKDSLAVAVMKEAEIVGHVPYNITSLLSNFLRSDRNKRFVEVTGNALNGGAGYGMEVPCKYRLYGQREYIARQREYIQSLVDRELIDIQIFTR